MSLRWTSTAPYWYSINNRNCASQLALLCRIILIHRLLGLCQYCRGLHDSPPRLLLSAAQAVGSSELPAVVISNVGGRLCLVTLSLARSRRCRGLRAGATILLSTGVTLTS